MRQAGIAARRANYVGRSLTTVGLRTGGWVNPARAGELKYIDVSLGATSFPLAGTGVLTLLNGCIQGSDATNRIGRKVNLKSIQTRISNTVATTGISNGPNFRVIIFYDKQANATAPAVTDVLLTDAFASNMNLNNRDRFVILMDKTSAESCNYNWNMHDYRKVNCETIFNSGNAGTIGDIQTGSLYMLTYLASGCLTTTEYVTVGRVRTRFMDA